MCSPETERNIANKISGGRIYSGVFPAMSLSNWLHYLAIGGVLVASLCGGESQAQTDSNPPSDQSQQAQPAASEPSPPQGKPGADYRQPACKSPASAEEANFCEQRRS